MNQLEDWESKTFLPPDSAMMSDMNVLEPDVQGDGSAESAENTLLLVIPAIPDTVSMVCLMLFMTELAFSDNPRAEAAIHMLLYSVFTLVQL